MRRLPAWFTTPTTWQQRGVEASAWPGYSPRKRRWSAIGLTMLCWGVVIGVLLLLGAKGRTFWLSFLPLAVLIAAMFTLLASGEVRRLLPALVAIRRASLVLLAISIGVGGVLAVVRLFVALAG